MFVEGKKRKEGKNFSREKVQSSCYGSADYVSKKVLGSTRR